MLPILLAFCFLWKNALLARLLERGGSEGGWSAIAIQDKIGELNLIKELMERELLTRLGSWRSLSSGRFFMAQSKGRREIESPLELAQRLSLPFLDDPYLLTRALTHTSYLNENTDVLDDNERLEFLGDAVLDFIVGAWLFESRPEMREGELTRARSALVRTEQLAAFARQIDLGRAMRLGRGEQRTGGYNRPALLCGTFEALIGAIYMKAGFEAVNEFFTPLLNAIDDHILDGGTLNDFKSRLQEWTQSQRMGVPHYVTVSETGPDHAKIFEIEAHIDGKAYGRGSGQSKSVATQLAAKNTLEMLGLL